MNFKSKLKIEFHKFNKRYFDSKLNDVKLEISDKMKNSAGIFYPPQNDQKTCKIRLNGPMLSLRSDKKQMETLLHEMIHAFLYFEGKASGKHVKPHGKEFQLKIKQLNSALSINIKTKHRFMSWYRCDGKCREKVSCLYGYVSRACNKTISDLMSHKNHLLTYGGTFRISKEPRKKILKVITKLHKEVKSKTAKKKTKQQGTGLKVLKLCNNRNSIDYFTDDEALIIEL